MSVSTGQHTYFEKVWDFVRQVPSGKVVTYGQIAQSLPPPPEQAIERGIGQAGSAARLVGSAMAACPADVPWHRVINAQGKVSNLADANRQLKLLEAEGLSFIQGRIDLHEHQWPGINVQGTNERDRPKQQTLF